MARLISDSGTKEVQDGSDIVNQAETLGVPFGCYEGHCGACLITIIEGNENLSELTEKEKAYGLEKNQRLACQCRIKHGDVKIKY
jgi:ferredoxin